MWSLWQGRYSRWYLLLHHKVAQQVTFLCISDHDHRLPVLTVHLISQVNEYHVLVYRTLAVTPASLASLGLYAFMPVHLSIYIYLYLSIHLSIYLSICLSVCVCLCLSVSVSVSLSVCPPVSVRPAVYPSFHPSVRPCTYIYPFGILLFCPLSITAYHSTKLSALIISSSQCSYRPKQSLIFPAS